MRVTATACLGTVLLLAVSQPAFALSCARNPGPEVRAVPVAALGHVTHVRTQAPGGDGIFTWLLRQIGWSQEGDEIIATVRITTIYKGILGDEVQVKTRMTPRSPWGDATYTRLELGAVRIVGAKEADGSVRQQNGVCSMLVGMNVKGEERTPRLVPPERLLEPELDRIYPWDLLESFRSALAPLLADLKKDPGNEMAYRQAQRLLQSLGDAERETSVVEGFLAAHPDDVEARRRLARLACQAARKGTTAPPDCGP